MSQHPGSSTCQAILHPETEEPDQSVDGLVIRVNREPLRFGWLGTYGHFNGWVRDVSVHGRAMTAAEVFAHYLAR